MVAVSFIGGGKGSIHRNHHLFAHQKWYNMFINHEGFFIVEIIFQVVYIFLLNCEASFLLTDKLFPWIH
jgi:hypothetical protein